jgi:hypothetical protein
VRRAPDRERVALGLVLALGLALRLLLFLNRGGALWLEEDVPQRYALSLWGFATGHPDPNPHMPAWPDLSIYFFFMVQAVRFALGRLAGVYAGTSDFAAALTLDPDVVRSSGMLAAIAVGVLALWAAARLARRCLGPGWAPWVALVLAVDPLFVRHSLVIAPDMLLTLCVLLGLLAALAVAERGRLGDSLRSGLWLGLGTACKYSPALLAVPIVLAHARRPGGRRGPRVLLDGRLWAAAATSLAAFALASPFALLDLAARRRQLGVGAAAVTGAHFGTAQLPTALRYALEVLPGDLGWPLWLLALAALVWTLLRRWREHALLLSFLVPYAVAFGALPIVFPRYLLPVLPLLLVLTAAAAREARRWPGARPALVVAAVAAALGFALAAWTSLSGFLPPDTRTLARRWFLVHAPDRALVAQEFLGPALPRRQSFDEAAARPGVSPARRLRLRRGPAYLTVSIPLNTQDPEITAPFYDPTLYLDFDWIVVSDGVRGRFRAEPGRFPAQVDFYRALDSLFILAYRSPALGVAGPAVAVYRPDPARRASVESWWAKRALLHPAPARQASAARLARAFAERAQLLEEADRLAAALPDWERAVSWEGAPALWWFHCGVCAEVAGDWESARAAHAAAFARDTTLLEAGLSWAEDAARLRRWEESAGALARLLARKDLAAPDRARAERLRAAVERARRAGPPGHEGGAVPAAVSARLPR